MQKCDFLIQGFQLIFRGIELGSFYMMETLSLNQASVPIKM